MKSLLNEQRLSLTELATEQNVSTSSTWRWAQRGVKGIRLETFSVGGRRFTTHEAFERFVENTTRASSSCAGFSSPRTRRQAEANRLRAERELNDDGV